MKKNLDFKLLRVFFALHTYPAKSSAGIAATMVTEVKLHCFHGRGSTTVMEVIFFLPFLNEFGNSKLFELYLIFYCHHRGTATAMEEV